MRRFACCLVFLSAAFVMHAQMPVIGADSLMRHYTEKMDRYIDRDSALGGFYKIDLYGISVYAGPNEKKAGQPEYRVTWSELPVYKNIVATAPREEAIQIMRDKGSRPFPPDVYKQYGMLPEYVSIPPSPRQPLSGIKIAIDPGHIAHDTATGRLEDKYVRFRTFDGKDSVDISLAEGMLTWQTADILAGKLRAQGAIVMLTRKAPHITAFGKTFEQWKKDDYARTLDSLIALDPGNRMLGQLKSGKLKDDRSIFRYVFRDAELRKRSEIINAFHPDLSIVIHFNVDEKNKDWKKPTDKNFCMTFVGGSFQPGELSDSERRYDFLRLLLTDELEKSIYVSGLAALQYESVLEVPLAKPKDATYLVANCVPAGFPGVYCRNLSLTRLIQGTLIYGETLYQDNREECLLLSKKARFTAEGDPPFVEQGRLNEVADAYYRAVIDWAKTR